MEIIRPQPITQKQRELQLGATEGNNCQQYIELPQLQSGIDVRVESAHTEYPDDQGPHRRYATASSLNGGHSSNILAALSSVEPPDSYLPTTHSVQDEHTSLSSLLSLSSTIPVPMYGQTHSMLHPEYHAAELSPRTIPTSLPSSLWNTGGLSSFCGAGEAPECVMTQDSLDQEPQYT